MKMVYNFGVRLEVMTRPVFRVESMFDTKKLLYSNHCWLRLTPLFSLEVKSRYTQEVFFVVVVFFFVVFLYIRG